MNNFLRQIKFMIKNGKGNIMSTVRSSYKSTFCGESILTILKNIDNTFGTPYQSVLRCKFIEEEITKADDKTIDFSKTDFMLRIYIDMNKPYHKPSRIISDDSIVSVDFIFKRISGGGRRYIIDSINLIQLAENQYNSGTYEHGDNNNPAKDFYGDLTIKKLGYITEGLTADVANFIVNEKYPIEVYFNGDPDRWKVIEQTKDKVVYQVGDRYISAFYVAEGVNYTVYDLEYNKICDGVYNDINKTNTEVVKVIADEMVDFVIKREKDPTLKILEIDFDEFMKKVNNKEYLKNIKSSSDIILTINKNNETELFADSKVLDSLDINDALSVALNVFKGQAKSFEQLEVNEEARRVNMKLSIIIQN